MSDFMQRQITGKQTWLEVNTGIGIDFIDAAGLGLFVRNSDCPSQPLTNEEFARYQGMIQPYCEGEVYSWENRKGYGARLSAPGYMDCTEWAVFDSEEEARAYLDEYYPEDESESEPCPC